MAAVSGLPRQEPILDDLLDVAAHNERVERIRDVIETSFSGVAKFVEGIIGACGPSFRAIRRARSSRTGRRRSTSRRSSKAGFAYATYLRLKISATVDRYAQSVCDVCDFPADSNHAQLVRAVLREWAEERKLFQQEGEPTEEQLAFLRELDLGYGQRRLRFVTSALRWWYRDLQDGKPNIPPRDQLDQGKKLLYDAVDKLRNLMSGDAFPTDLVEQIAACFPDDEVRSFLADERARREGVPGGAARAARGGREVAARPPSPRASQARRRSSTATSTTCHRAGRPSAGATCSSATSASRSGTSCSFRSRRSPTPARTTASWCSG